MTLMLGIDINNLSKAERIIANSFIVGGIVFFSTLTATDAPTLQGLWSAFVGAGLAGFTQLATLTKDDDDDDIGYKNKNVPKEYRKPKKPTGLLMFV